MLDFVVRRCDRITIIKLTGEFFLSSIDEVRALWQREIESSPEVIAFDCANLNFIDSTAIGTLVMFLNNSVKCHITMVFIDPSDAVKKIFMTAKLNRIFTIMTAEEFSSEFVAGK